MIKRLFSFLFSGGVGYVQGGIIIAAAGFIGFHWLSYHNLKKDNVKLKNDNFWLELEKGWQQDVLLGIATTQTRRETQRAEQLTLEDVINALPKTNFCGNAPAISAALTGVSERRGAADATNP